MIYRQTTIRNLLKRQETLSEEEMESPERRDALVNWMIGIHSKSNFKQETLHQSVSIVDRFLARRSISPDKDQLLGAAALWIARKL